VSDGTQEADGGPSVVVPTRDRPGALDACLRALDAQTLRASEIVVVDDASRDEDAVAAVVGRHQRARVVRGAGRGPAAARNLGARVARGRIICFTDDDCRPAPGWLAAIDACFARGEQVVAGPTVAGTPGAVVAAAQIVTNHLTDSSRDRDGSHVAFAPTSNLACRGEIAAAVPFDERYPLAAGEDRDWCRQVAKRGIAIAYEPGAVVAHHASSSVRSFWRQQVRYGRGARRFHGGSRSELSPPSFYVALVRRGFTDSVATGLLVLVAQVAAVVGYAQDALVERRTTVTS
jgi:glycosyltransferase involved in cell wall biosynthesis